MVVALGIYGLMRLQVIVRNGSFTAITSLTYEGKMFLLEFVLGVILPVVLLSFRRMRTSPRWLVTGSFFAVLGFVVNRLNISVTGMERAAGTRYLPSIPEIIVSVGLVAIGMAVFALAVHFFPIFPERKLEGGD
jgi:Ni/Fe-hydrogenase subunit HybB-like protein